MPGNPYAPDLARDLVDARLQVHHAAQFATALGISYLPHAADDSHTNLEWLGDLRALASNAVTTPRGSVRIGVSVPDLVLLVLNDGVVRARNGLDGCTIAKAADWIRAQLDSLELPGNQYSLARHYEIPEHPVASGSTFSPNAERLEQLACWYGNAALALDAIRQSNAGSSVRCWPHHFDIATLITPRAGASVGAGLSPGDVYYAEPYFYVNASPQPALSALPESLAGGGTWHTTEWIGAVLPGSRITPDAGGQIAQAGAFLESGVRACRSLVS